MQGGLIIFSDTQFHINSNLHRHRQMVGGVEEGFSHLSGNSGVAILVDALIEVVAIVAHSMIRVRNIAQVVVTERNLVGHQNEVETVVEAAGREALVGIAPCGLGVKSGIPIVVAPLSHPADAIKRIDETDLGIAIGLGQQPIGALTCTIHIKIAHNQHIFRSIMLVHIIHRNLHQRTSRGFVALSRLGMCHNAHKFNGVASC